MEKRLSVLVGLSSKLSADDRKKRFLSFLQSNEGDKKSLTVIEEVAERLRRHVEFALAPSIDDSVRELWVRFHLPATLRDFPGFAERVVKLTRIRNADDENREAIGKLKFEPLSAAIVRLRLKGEVNSSSNELGQYHEDEIFQLIKSAEEGLPELLTSPQKPKSKKNEPHSAIHNDLNNDPSLWSLIEDSERNIHFGEFYCYANRTLTRCTAYSCDLVQDAAVKVVERTMPTDRKLYIANVKTIIKREFINRLRRQKTATNNQLGVSLVDEHRRDDRQAPGSALLQKYARVSELADEDRVSSITSMQEFERNAQIQIYCSVKNLPAEDREDAIDIFVDNFSLQERTQRTFHSKEELSGDDANRARLLRQVKGHLTDHYNKLFTRNGGIDNET